MSGSRAGYLIAVSVMAVVVSPNFIVQYMSGVDLGVREIFYLWLGLVLVPLPLLVVPVRGYLRFLSLFILGIPAYVFHYSLLRGIPSVSSYGAVFETDREEVVGVVTGMEWFLLATVAVVIACNVAIGRIDRSFRPGRKAKGAILVLALVPLILNTARDIKVAHAEERGVIFSLEKRISQTYPYGEVVKIARAYGERLRLAHALEDKKDFRFGASKRRESGEREIYVVVVGETARYANWGINGYARDTSPRLSATPGVISFRNVYTMSNQTRMSVPMTLTRSIPEAPDRYLREKSLCAAFKEAGFRVYWLSNAPVLGGYDSTTSLIAMEADEIVRVNSLAEANDFAEGTHDDALLAPLAEALGRNDPKVAIFLQTVGSHYRYAMKYPASFDRFQPSGRDSRKSGFANLENREELVNSFDNTILFADHLLGEAIDAVAAQDAVAALFYFSDHGENLLDDGRQLFSHGTSGTPSEFELHIPFFIWLSERYHTAYPEKSRRLLERQDAPLSLSHFFPTVLDVADITYGEERLAESFAAEEFLPAPRSVLTMDREVIRLP
ncbi:MAG: phosphoethanolamine transferase [Nitrospinae bacterium]|nr:phosphoethanolamine transferase [Nitrospinota bacterium]